MPIVDAHGRQISNAEPMSLRRWESAGTDRLNSAHWGNVQDRPINHDLSLSLEALRKRTTHEVANNPTMAGVVRTHQVDLVGPAGPTLNIESDDETYNEDMEQVWRAWWADPDAQGRRSGADILRQWVAMFWSNGESLEQFVTDPEAEGPIKLRLLAIHPRRLATPAGLSGEKDIALGIRVNRLGRPVAYCILKESLFGDYAWLGTDYDTIPARDMLHLYLCDEPDQARGVPWAASALQPIADLRDYDNQVMDAARASADWSVYMYSDHVGLTPVALMAGDTLEVKRRTMRTLPAGWRVEQMKGEQPTTQYVEFRHERMAEMGRPVGMPLMIVRLNVQEHNYSGARFEGQIYNRHVEMYQIGLLQRHGLERILAAVEREARMAGLVGARPANARNVWTWPAKPSVDPAKDAEARRTDLESGVLTLTEALAERGTDLETNIRQRVAQKTALEAAGLPLSPDLREAPAPGTLTAEKDQDDEKDEEKPKPKARGRAIEPVVIPVNGRNGHV